MRWLRRRHPLETWAWLAAVGVVVLNAWVSDDAYITLRTVEHVVRGEGLVWNPGERVQAYTHPLWMGGLVVARVLTGDAYFAAVGLGVLVSAAALLWLVRLSESRFDTAVVLLALVLSKSFVHYATSGLENPATALLVAWMAAVAVRPWSASSLRRVLFLAALVFLNRMDIAVLVAPLVLLCLWRDRRSPWRVVRAGLPALGVVLAWEGFSLFYYGSLVPNTAYAKLGAGIDGATLARNGVGALGTNFAWDPTTLVFVAVAGAWVLIRARRHAVAVALVLGAFAYLGYFVRIGGDFMNGRFLMAPVFAVALAFVLAAPLRTIMGAPVLHVGFALALGLVSTLGSRPPVAPPGGEQRGWSVYGVADEQAFYWSRTGLFAGGHGDRPRDDLVAAGRRLACDEVTLGDSIGFFGYGAGNCGTIVDRLALADPLVARIPAVRDANWRVGHYLRNVPDGYLESVRTGECQMDDVGLCELWGHLRRVTRAPLLSEGRLESIGLLAFGDWRRLVDEDAFRRPELVRAEWPLTAPVELGESGLSLEGDVRSVRMWLSGRSRYLLSCRRGSEVLDRTRVDFERSLADRRVEVTCPEEADGLLVEPSSVPRCCATYRAGPIAAPSEGTE